MFIRTGKRHLLTLQFFQTFSSKKGKNQFKKSTITGINTDEEYKSRIKEHSTLSSLKKTVKTDETLKALTEPKYKEMTKEYYEEIAALQIDKIQPPSGLRIGLILNNIIMLYQGWNLVIYIPLQQIFYSGTLIGLSRCYYEFYADIHEKRVLDRNMNILYLLIFISIFSSFLFKFLPQDQRKFVFLVTILNYLGLLIHLRNKSNILFIPHFIRRDFTFSIIFNIIVGIIAWQRFDHLKLENPLYVNEYQISQLQSQFEYDLFSIIIEGQSQIPNVKSVQEKINSQKEIVPTFTTKMKTLYDDFSKKI